MAQIDELRQWRLDSINSHLYTTAELVSTKILAMSGHPDDAYWLSQTYYGMGEYLRGAELILNGRFEQDSMKCRYIAALCLIRAQELDKALDVVQKGLNDVPLAGNSTVLGHSQQHQTQPPTPIIPQPPNTSQNRVRVVSTSSLRAPGASGARTVSGSSRISVIFPDEDSDAAPPGPVMPFGEEEEELHNVFLRSLLHYLLGRIHTLQSRFVQAKACYIAALRIDARCYEAFAQLSKYHAMTPLEEWQLLKSLDFSRVGADFGRSIYALRLSALAQDVGLTEAVENLLYVYQIPDTDSDVLIAQAEVSCARGHYSVAQQIFAKVLETDPRNLRVYTSYADCLLELNEVNQLHKVAHELALVAQEAPETWYVIGVYYLATKRTAEARQYFSKASLLDPGYASAWVAFAQTFAEESEHEQAVTAFSTAVRLFPGYNLPYIYIGMQYLQLLNLSLAVKYLEGAQSLFDEDPLVLNELGLVRYHQNELPHAIAMLDTALKIAQRTECDVALQVGIKANLGFALRRDGQVDAALEVFTDVAQHSRLDTNVLSAIALCHLQLEQYYEATEKLALALAINRDDPVANDLMKRAVKATANQFDVATFAAANRELMYRRRVEFD